MSERSQENTPDSEHRIRERAYHLWEADGRPEGRAQDYWERAKASISNEDSEKRAPSGTGNGKMSRRRTSLLSAK